MHILQETWISSGIPKVMAILLKITETSYKAWNVVLCYIVEIYWINEMADKKRRIFQTVHAKRELLLIEIYYNIIFEAMARPNNINYSSLKLPCHLIPTLRIQLMLLI